MANGHNLFVSFDLVQPMDNYDRLGKAIVALGIPVKIGTTLWYVDSPVGAREAEQVLRDACNPGDTLMVIDASTNFAISHNLRPMSGAMLRTLWNGQPPDRTVELSDPLAAANDVPGGPSEIPPGPTSPQTSWMNRLFPTHKDPGGHQPAR